MNTFETAAVISLIDHLSGPLASLAGKVAAQNSKFAQSAAAMENVGKHMTYALTTPMALAAVAMTHTAKKFSENENTIEGILKSRARMMKGSAEEAEKWIAREKNSIRELGEIEYKKANGLLRMSEYQATVAQAIKAGHDAEAAAAVARNANHLALVGRYDQHEAADHLLNVSQAFGFSSNKLDGKGGLTPITFKEANDQLARYADLMTTMATNANMTVTQAAEAFKLSAPLAHVAGMNPEFLGTMIEAMAEKGIKGSEAGVNLRSYIGALLAPKSTAVPGMQLGGVDLNAFRQVGGISPEDFVKFAKSKGYLISPEAAKAAFDRASIKANGDKGALDVSQLPTELSESLKRLGGKHAPVLPHLAMKAANEYLANHAEHIDVIGATMEMRKKIASGELKPAQLAAFMEKRQIPRSLAYLTGPDEHGIDVFSNAARRMFGDNWQQVLDKYVEMHKKSAKEAEKYLEAVARKVTKDRAELQALEHSQGLEGALNRVGAAYQHLVEKLYHVGAFENVVKMLDGISHTLDRISNMSPHNLTRMVDALAALAVGGPLLLLSGRLMKIAGGMAALGRVLVGLEAATAASGIAKLGSAAAGTGAAAGAAAAGVNSLKASLIGFGVVAALAVGAFDMLERMTREESVRKGVVHGGTPEEKDEPAMHRYFGRGPAEAPNRMPSGLPVDVDMDAWNRWEYQKPKYGSVGEAVGDLFGKLGGLLKEVLGVKGAGAGEVSLQQRLDLINSQLASIQKFGDPALRVPQQPSQQVPSLTQGGDSGISQLLAAVQQINSKPVDVQVQGQVHGEVLQSIRVDPSPLFIAKMDEVKKIALQGNVSNVGKSGQGPTGPVK